MELLACIKGPLNFYVKIKLAIQKEIGKIATMTSDFQPFTVSKPNEHD